MVSGANPKPSPEPNDKPFTESTPNSGRYSNITPESTNVLGTSRSNPIDDEEYQNFLAYLFRESVQPKINKYRNESYNLSDFPYLKKLIGNPLSLPVHTKETMDMVNFIVNHCETDSDIQNCFTASKLQSAINSTNEIIKETKSLAQDFGFTDILDEHLGSIIGGLKIRHLQQRDFEVLEYLGSRNSKVELEGSIYQFKTQMLNRIGLLSVLPIIKTSDFLQETEDLLVRSYDTYDTSKKSKSEKTTRKPHKTGHGAKINQSSNGPISPGTPTTPSLLSKCSKS